VRTHLALDAASIADRGERALIWVNGRGLLGHFGFRSRAIRCASAIWSGVILAAFRRLRTGLLPSAALGAAERRTPS